MFFILADGTTAAGDGLAAIAVIAILFMLFCIIVGTWRSNHTEDGELIEDYENWRPEDWED